MSTKNSIARYHLLDEKLQRGKYTISELIAACYNQTGIQYSKRTIEDDIAYLRSYYGAPIPRPKDNRYGYDDRSFSIKNVNLTEKEINAFGQIFRILQNFNYLPEFNMLEEMAIRMRCKVNEQLEQPQTIYFENSIQLKGLGFLKTILEATEQKQALRITYKKFDAANGYQTDLHPYLLKQFHQRWFMLGYSSHHQNVRLFALDRLEQVLKQPLLPFVETTMPLNSYFDQIIGVTTYPDNKPVNIIAQVSLHKANYLITKPLHASQELVSKTKEVCVFKWFLQINPELESFILSYGADIYVIEPPVLRDKIKQITQKMLERYN
jgi:predicted DNA-binding transcriptional regulator YafY